VKTGTVIVVLCLASCACGASHVSEAAFRAKANAICRTLNRRVSSLGPATTRSFERRLANIDLGIGELSRLKPPRQDRATYADFLSRLRRLLAFAKDTGPQLLALSRQLERAMPKRVSIYGAARRTRQFKRLARLIAALEKPAQEDAHLAGVDARALHLPQCAVGASGD
jgi:hypothetical protein